MAVAETADLAGIELGTRWAVPASGGMRMTITSRLVDRCEQRINGLQGRWGDLAEPRSSVVTDLTLTKPLSASDLLIALSVDHPEDPGRGGTPGAGQDLEVPGRPLKALRRQCEDMLRVTPDAFVFLYDGSGVNVASALAFASSSLGTRGAPTWSLRQFLEAHLRSFVGDERLGVTRAQDVRGLIEGTELTPRQAIILGCRIHSAGTRAARHAVSREQGEFQMAYASHEGSSDRYDHTPWFPPSQGEG